MELLHSKSLAELQKPLDYTVTPCLSHMGLSQNLIYPTLCCESPSLGYLQSDLMYPTPGTLPTPGWGEGGTLPTLGWGEGGYPAYFWLGRALPIPGWGEPCLFLVGGKGGTLPTPGWGAPCHSWVGGALSTPGWGEVGAPFLLLGGEHHAYSWVRGPLPAPG